MSEKAIATAPNEETRHINLTVDEQTLHDAKNHAWLLGTENRVAEQEREWREIKLKETDRYGLSDIVMPDEIKIYRQELRDMPEASGFPLSHTRPKILGD